MAYFSTFRRAAVWAALLAVALPALVAFANPGNTPPQLAPIGDRIVPIGTHLGFNLVATDAEGDTLTFSATGLPTGATFNSQTGRFDWLAGFAHIGQHIVTFTVTDDGTPPYSTSETIRLIVPGGVHKDFATDRQIAVVGNPFPKRLRVRLVDAHGNGMADEIVRYRVAAASARFAGESEVDVVTDADGFAEAPELTAGPEPGLVTVFAIAPGHANRTFTLNALPNVGVAVRAQIMNLGVAGEPLTVRLQAVNADGQPTPNFTGTGTVAIPGAGREPFEILPADQGQKDIQMPSPKLAGNHRIDVITPRLGNRSPILQSSHFAVSASPIRRVCLMNDPTRTAAADGILPGMDIKVGDIFGNPVANVPVNFIVSGGQFGTLVAGSGFVPIGTTATGISGANGRVVSPLVQMNGSGTVTADITGTPPGGDGVIVEAGGAVRGNIVMLPAAIAAPVIDEVVPSVDALSVFWFNPVPYDHVRILDAHTGGEIVTVAGTITSHTIGNLAPNTPVSVRLIGIVGAEESLPSATRTTFTLATPPSPADILVRRAFRGMIELDIVGLNNLAQGCESNAVTTIVLQRCEISAFSPCRGFTIR